MNSTRLVRPNDGLLAILMHNNQFEVAENLFAESEAVFLQKFGGQSNGYIQFLERKAQCKLALNKTEEGLQLYEKVVELKKQLYDSSQQSISN